MNHNFYALWIILITQIDMLYYIYAYDQDHVWLPINLITKYFISLSKYKIAIYNFSTLTFSLNSIKLYFI